ncbi:MAG: peptidyl-prolyl cis-trans isomerase [Balneolales bacterium]
MQKLRASTKYIIWLLILSFGLLWVLADTQVFDAMVSGPQNMGEVNRDPVSYAEFNQRMNLYIEQHREQTGASPDMELRAQYEDMAWDQLVIDKILKQKMHDMGITVTDSELIEMVTGENPDPYIRQQFMREDGTIDRVALQNAIEAPENREIWIMIERQLREQRRQQKLSQYLQASLRVSEFEVLQYYKKQNSRVDFRYVRFPYADVPGDEIEVSDAEIRTYYQNNKSRFHRNKSWRFSYVTFPIQPTEEDTLRTLNRLSELRDEFRQADDVEQFLSDHYSETSYFENYLKASEIRREHLNVFELDVNEVSEPYLYQNWVHMIRLLEDRPAEQTYVRIRQIRLNADETGQELAEELVQRIEEGESFEQLAAAYSQHSESVNRGGELGYIERNDKPAPISDAIFSASAGSIIGPLAGNDGIYIFQIVDRTNRDVRFADLSRNIEADPFETVQRLSNDADDFQYFAASDGFREEAERNGYTIQEGFVSEGNPIIPGLGQSRVILNALSIMRRGRVSDVIETEDMFIVIRLDEVIPEGPRPLEEVRSQIESLVRDQKRREVVLRQVSDMLDSVASLDELAESSGKTVEIAERVRLNAFVVPGAGREPKIIGSAFFLPPGEYSPPIAGNNAVFVMVVDERSEADPSLITSDERRQIREELQQQQNNRYGLVWMDRLKSEADIRDFRTQQRLAASQQSAM